MVEAAPSSPLVMSEPDLLLEVLVVPFDAPAQLGEIDQLGERDVFRQGREPVLRRLLLVLGPFDQEPFLGAGLLAPFVTVCWAYAHSGIARGEPVGRTFAPGDGFPGRLRQAERQGLGLDRLVFAIAPQAAGRAAPSTPVLRRQGSRALGP